MIVGKEIGMETYFAQTNCTCINFVMLYNEINNYFPEELVFILNYLCQSTNFRQITLISFNISIKITFCLISWLKFMEWANITFIVKCIHIINWWFYYSLPIFSINMLLWLPQPLICTRDSGLWSNWYIVQSKDTWELAGHSRSIDWIWWT